MKELNAVELRRSLGQIADALKDGEPILLRLNRRPVGVIISLQDFEERFALADAQAKRQSLVDEILADVRRADVSVEEALDELRER